MSNRPQKRLLVQKHRRHTTSSDSLGTAMVTMELVFHRQVDVRSRIGQGRLLLPPQPPLPPYLRPFFRPSATQVICDLCKKRSWRGSPSSLWKQCHVLLRPTLSQNCSM